MLKTVKKLFDLGIVATYDKGSKTLSIEVADSSIAQADLLCRAVAFGKMAATLHCRGLGWKKVYTNGESRTVLASNLGTGVVLSVTGVSQFEYNRLAGNSLFHSLTKEVIYG